MKKVILSIISKENLSVASLLINTCDKYFTDWYKIFYLSDLSELEIITDELLPCINAEFRSAESLFEDDFKELAFFFNESEFIEFIKVKAAKKLFLEYDFILMTNYNIFFNNTFSKLEFALNQENIAVKITKSIAFPNINIPDSFVFPNKSILNSEIFGISKGIKSDIFLKWCEEKFCYLFTYMFSASVNPSYDLELSIEQSEFIFSWMSYISVFDIKLENLLLEYNNYKITSYKYNRFNDGTSIQTFLRSYYIEDVRLRQLCDKNPFSKRKLFTDYSVLTGDENKLPITAMEMCIWKHRSDLQLAFPQYKDKDRVSYVDWFLKHAKEEYKLEDNYFKYINECSDKFIIAPKNIIVKKRTIINRLINKIKKIFHIKFSKNIIKFPLKLKQYKPGINLCGFVRGNFGVGEATRILAKTFDAGEIPFTIVNHSPVREKNFTNHDWDQKITNQFTYSINIICINSDWLPSFLETISPDALKNRYNIAFWYWELPEFPDCWVDNFKYFDEIWTASEFTAEAFRKKTDKPVFCLPCCVTLEYNSSFDKKYFNLPENKFLFLMMYDVRSMQERKNPMAAIKAFLKSFEHKDDVVLIVKVSMPSNWPLEEELQSVIDSHKNIIAVYGNLPRTEVNSLINCCDAFISLHRSEGFGLCPAEAMCLGKPTIITNWSGNTEYMTNDNCCPVDYEIVELEKNIGPYEKGSHWAEPSINVASRYMKKLVEDKNYYNLISNNARKTISEKFSPETISKIARARLNKLNLL